MTMLLIPIDAKSTRPIYIQITEHIMALARAGQLQPNDRLPPSRVLAEQLQVHRSTVVNAYEELKARGVIETRQGSGSYITEGMLDTALAQRITSPVLPETLDGEMLVSELWRLNQAEGLISLALGIPADDLVLVDTFEQARQRVLRRDGAQAMTYIEAQGFLPLRRTIARDLARHGMLVDADDIIITCGAQEGISLVARALTAPGDDALIELPTFFGTLYSIHHLGINLRGFDLAAAGPHWPSLDQQLQQSARRPRFAYVTPDHQNPTGICWTMEERYRFLKWAAERDVPVIEDGTYRDLLFDGLAYPALRSLDPEVIYIGSFSKSLIPGLRIGFVVASGRMRDHLVRLKSVTSGSGESLSQRALAEFLTSGGYAAHIERITAVYRRRRDALLHALETFFPPTVQWTCPVGGFYVWVMLPHDVPVLEVFRRAFSHGLVVAPAHAFYPRHSFPNGMRLCFARHPEDVLSYAGRVLGHVLKTFATA